MGELQILLAIVGALVVTGVVAHGAWQSRRAGPRQPLPAAAVPPAPEAAVKDLAEPVMVEPMAPRRAQPRLDALIDAIASLALETPVAGEAALLHFPSTRRAGSKPFLIEGLSDGSGRIGEWEPVQAGHVYREFQAGVQMANRLGPLNQIEYSEFVQKVQQFADGIGATPDLPDMVDVVARARELDAFASHHDAQLTLHLRARSAAWSLGYVQQHAARQGFVPGAVPGRLVLPATEEGAPAVLSLQFDAHAAFADDPHQAVVRDVVLAFDVPQTPAPVQPFAAWRGCALALAADMDAQIVDDKGQGLTPQAFDAIGHELEALYHALESRDLAAGSAAARRLFN